jgi:hypothetical protein
MPSLAKNSIGLKFLRFQALSSSDGLYENQRAFDGKEVQVSFDISFGLNFGEQSLLREYGIVCQGEVVDYAYMQQILFW